MAGQDMPASIEVEKKFFVPGRLAELVQKAGGSAVGQKRFIDRYWDHPKTCVLGVQDCWLRQRESVWELKVPHGDAGAHRVGGERTVFRELSGHEAILSELPSWTDLLTRDLDGAGIDAYGFADVESLSSHLGLRQFAAFETIRAKYELPDFNASIDSDEALGVGGDSWRHSVMEIEIMCQTQDDVEEALNTIDKIAVMIGAQELPAKQGGKLEAYIRAKCPQMLAKLVEAGVLPE